MADPYTLKILNFDGGGMRGYLSQQWFQLFLNRWGIDPATIWKHFDIICGTSIGGMIALSLAYGITLDTIESFFVDTGPYVFTQRTNLLSCSFDGISGNRPSNRPNSAQKLAEILANDPFYATSGGCRTYGSTLLYDTLDKTFGESTLGDLKTNVIIPTYKVTNPEFGYGQGEFTFISNLNLYPMVGQNSKIVDVAKATSAAPVYLPAAIVGDQTYIDGGVYINSPVQAGFSAMQAIKPLSNRACILSVGTGLGTMQFQNDGSLSGAAAGVFDTINQIFSLFDISSTGAQESTNICLNIESVNTLNNTYFYRFQPTLDPNLDTTLDNSSPDILAYYKKVAQESFNNDLNAIDNFIGHLMA